ncbi:hypothetical protein TYRP_003023 [Tyrophagus putrescentiae]|nr:hypothetical protein TYRP_003023 [Tyrophagus putrescentiae]
MAAKRRLLASFEAKEGNPAQQIVDCVEDGGQIAANRFGNEIAPSRGKIQLSIRRSSTKKSSAFMRLTPLKKCSGKRWGTVRLQVGGKWEDDGGVAIKGDPSRTTVRRVGGRRRHQGTRPLQARVRDVPGDGPVLEAEPGDHLGGEAVEDRLPAPGTLAHVHLVKEVEKLRRGNSGAGAS